jgi:hypothetical protein
MLRRPRRLEDFTAEIESHFQLEVERSIPARRAIRVDPTLALRHE